MELKNWYIQKRHDGKFIAGGNVYHSPRFPDGRFISTSHVEKVVTGDEEGLLEIHTRNSVYQCRWEYCAFDQECTQEYLSDFSIHKSQFEEQILCDMEDNSVLIVIQTHANVYGFYQKNGEIKKLNRCGNSDYYSVLQSNESDAENIDIRFRGCKGRIELFYADIPEGMQVYLQNHGGDNIEFWSKKEKIEIKDGERKPVNYLYCNDYKELIRQCAGDKEKLPRRWELFSKERVLQEIEEDVQKQIEREYMLITEVKENELFLAGVGSGLEIAMMCSRYDMMKDLLERGASFHLDDTLLCAWFPVSDKERCRILTPTFMEFLCLDYETPVELYALIKKRVMEREGFPMKKSIRLQIDYKEEWVREFSIHNIKRLQSVWEEAAEELLLAWVKFYLNNYPSIKTEIWEALFAAFLDKRGLIFNEIVAQHLRIYEERDYFVYPREPADIALPEYWRMCTKGMDKLLQKEIFIDFMHQLSGNHLNEYACMICHFLTEIVDFGDFRIEMRDECIQRFLKQDVEDITVWRSLLESTFLPEEYLDIYIEMLMQCEEKTRYLLPLFITAKMKGYTENE